MNPRRLLTILILVGIVAGAIAGQILYDPTFRITMPDARHAHPAALAAFHFVGNTVFMGLLKMIVIPLIATSVLIGVTSVGDFRELGQIGIATLVFYFASMLIATVVGLILVTSIRPGERVAAQDHETAQRTFEESESVKRDVEAGPRGLIKALQNLVEQIIPSNIVAAAAGGQALPVIFFSILLGVVLTTMGDRARPVTDFIAASYEAIMRLVDAIIWLTPIGVFALLAWTVARIGLGVFFEAIGAYMGTVLAGLSIQGLIVLPAACWLLGRCNPWRFFGHMRQALLTALGTDSSSATLPVTMECATENAGISRKAAGFVLPLGSTINMDGTALYEAVAVVFLAQAYGIELSTTVLILVAVSATLAAVGAAGIPSAGLVTMVIVVETVNGALASLPGSPSIPIAAIGLIVGVDRILDMFRTTVNVWGDAVGAAIIDRLDRDYFTGNRTATT
ncbi:MAG: dicarboxylate/amino acid:cation symporter [Phycisphaerae bacterium]|nr:dicarboxylate/amino acid:cation symporter [Phycisphaerae bacterium]